MYYKWGEGCLSVCLTEYVYNILIVVLEKEVNLGLQSLSLTAQCTDLSLFLSLCPLGEQKGFTGASEVHQVFFLEVFW